MKKVMLVFMLGLTGCVDYKIKVVHPTKDKKYYIPMQRRRVPNHIMKTWHEHWFTYSTIQDAQQKIEQWKEFHARPKPTYIKVK